MLIAKLFLPLSAPGLAAIGVGIFGVVSGPINAIEVTAIILGLVVVAVAGVFTIRSNVAKIWREQAEGEKAKNEDLTEKIAELRVELEQERSAKAQAVGDLETARSRTDLAPVLSKLDQLIGALHPTDP